MQNFVRDEIRLKLHSTNNYHKAFTVILKISERLGSCDWSNTEKEIKIVVKVHKEQTRESR